MEVAWNVYEGVQLMLTEYRGLELEKAPMKHDDFINHIRFHQFLEVKAPGISAVITAPKTQKMRASSEFEKMIKQIADVAEILVISKDGASNNILRKTTELSKATRLISHYRYSVFKWDPNKHNLSNKYRKFTEEEREALIGKWITHDYNCPKFHHKKEPAAVWYGFKPGDLIAEISDSDISLVKITPKLVI